MIKTVSIYINKIKILFTSGLLKECRGKGCYTVFSGFLSCFNSDVSPNQRDTSFNFNCAAIGSYPILRLPHHEVKRSNENGYYKPIG